MGNNAKHHGSILEKIKGLQKKLKELKSLTDKGKRIVAVIEKYESDKKKKVAPEELLLANLLAEVLMFLAEEMPPGISDYVEGCLEAFKTAIDSIIGIVYGKYKKMLTPDADDDDARDAAKLAAAEPITQQWLFDRWKLESIEKRKKK